MEPEYRCCKCLIADHTYMDKKLYMFTDEELKLIPLEYLIERADPIELLYAWHKLPPKYRGDFTLQIQLPCFVHYNRPEWKTHADGPPSSQAKCYLCKLALQKT